MALPGSFMDRVDKAGGIEAYNAAKIKAQKEAAEAIAEISTNDWKSITETVKTLRDFVQIGGTSEMISVMSNSIKDAVKGQITGALSPITNEINSIINIALAPIFAQLTEITNGLVSVVAEADINGLAIAGIAGAVLALFTGGSVGWYAIVAAVGFALIEAGLTAANQALPTDSGIVLTDAFGPSGSGLNTNWLAILRQIEASRNAQIPDPIYDPNTVIRRRQRGIEE